MSSGAQQNRGNLSSYLAHIDERIPNAKFLGFGFWVAWFSVAYSSSIWVDSSVESTAWVVGEMFFVSTLAHVATLLLFVIFNRVLTDRGRSPWFILSGGIVCTIGCILVFFAGPNFFSSQVVFYIGCALTGMGTAALCLNSGLLLCSIKPQKALIIIIYCELLAALTQFVVIGLPSPFGISLFIIIPLFSSACFLLGSTSKVQRNTSDAERLKPVKPFGRFLVTVGILSIAANMSKGMYQITVSPVQLAIDGNIINFITIICLMFLLLFLKVGTKELNFSHFFYPLAVLLVFSVLISYFFPNNAAIGVIISGVVFQFFDIAMWYVFVYIVYQSKISAIFVVLIGRAVVSAGVTIGNYLGSFCATTGADTFLSTIIFLTVFVAIIAIFFILPEKQVNKLLLPIPDEDSPDTEKDENKSPRKKGFWKQACFQYADSVLLTEREKEVFFLMIKGYGAQSISDKLTVSLYTTRAHIRNIYTKADVHSKNELTSKLEIYIESSSQDSEATSMK